MSIAVIVPDRDVSVFVKKLSELVDEDIAVEIDDADRSKVDVAILWDQPQGTISSLPNLKLICSFGAGVEHIINDPEYNAAISLTRIVDGALTASMSRYVVAAVSMFQYGFHFSNDPIFRMDYIRKPIYSPELTLGILGLGALGRASAKCCHDLGYNVLGLSRNKREMEGIGTFALSEMDDFLEQTNILVCMLPLTSQTKDLIDYSLLSKLKKPAFFINVGRGKQVVEVDLLKAIQEDVIQGACLDVVRKEPVTDDHPFIEESKIIITPHIASITNQINAAHIIGDNINRYRNGEKLLYIVDPVAGY
jgi:glyoxylate/hydroxypyruvate reductase A